jgi:ABC-type multidrug transport system ATPase subunit
MKSSFVIYDEPTSNLDMRYRRSLIRFLNEHA